MMNDLTTSGSGPFSCLARNKELVYSLARREIQARYQGSVFGVVWAVITPLFMLAIYTFVFGYVFKARWGGIEDKYTFAMALYASLLVFSLFSEIISRSPNIIIYHASYVTKVIFPIETLSWVISLSALFNYILGLIVWLAFYFIFLGAPPISFFAIPVIIFPLFLISTGLSWIISSLGVYIRDVAQLINIAVSSLMFVTPIFYPASALPEKYQKWLYINPLTAIIENTKAAMIFGTGFNIQSLLVSYIVSLSVFYLGFIWFTKVKKGFGDVL